MNRREKKYHAVSHVKETNIHQSHLKEGQFTSCRTRRSSRRPRGRPRSMCIGTIGDGEGESITDGLQEKGREKWRQLMAAYLRVDGT